MHGLTIVPRIFRYNFQLLDQFSLSKAKNDTATYIKAPKKTKNQIFSTPRSNSQIFALQRLVQLHRFHGFAALSFGEK